MIWHRTMTHEVRVKLRGGLIMRYVKEKLKHKKKKSTTHIQHTYVVVREQIFFFDCCCFFFDCYLFFLSLVVNVLTGFKLKL